MDLKDTYTRIAKDWHKDHQDDDWWVEGTGAFMRLLAQGASVLDVGCGAGFKSGYLARHGFSVTGIDFSDGLIDIARKEVPEVEFLVIDMREMGELPMFDGIFAQASLLHIPRAEIAATLQGLFAHLTPGGYLYVAVKGSRPGKPLEEVKEEHSYGYPYERFFSYFTIEELRGHFKDAGLEVVYENINTVGKTDWVQIIGKKV